MRSRNSRPWPSLLLAVLCVGAAIVAYLVVGPASQGASADSSTRLVKASRGLVQATVSGTGDIEPTTELDLGFKTSGSVKRIYVHAGEHVKKGQLVATLDPRSARVALEQATASRQAAEAKLTEVEEDGGETSSSTTEDAASSPSSGRASAEGEAGSSGSASEAGEAGPSGSSTTSVEESSSAEEASGSASEPTLSAAARRANIAAARAAAKSARLEVRSARAALAETRLYAPESGTIVSLAGEVGEAVDGTGTTKSEVSSAGGESESGGGAGSASSSSFAVLSNLRSLEIVVPLAASEIGSVKAGQMATVTIEALNERKLAAHVLEVATLPSSESGVVSYDVTFKLDQGVSGLKPGMSGTAEVVVKQAKGVTVPTEAIEGDSVTVVKNGKEQRRAIVTGLAGETTTIVKSGLKAGEEVLLPVSTSTETTGAGSSSTSARGSSVSGALGTAGTGGFVGGPPAGGAPGGGAGFSGAGGRP